MRVLGVVAPALVDFAVYGERTVARVCRKHLRRPSRRRQQHSLSAQCRQRCDKRSSERCFSCARISVEQKDRAVVGVGDKLAQRGNDFHLLAVGLVGKFAEYLRSDYAFSLVHVCKATEKNLILKKNSLRALGAIGTLKTLREKQNQASLILFFTRLALSLNKIGCDSEEQNQINLFCSSLILHYLCSLKLR